MTLRLYDSATREVRDFVPLEPGKVSIYHCGLTVQSAPHLGHIRKEVVFDVLRRWLAVQGYEVTVIANVTDIDDKILSKSAQAGVPWWAHAYHFERELHDAYAALGCIPPTYEPRATGHIPEMLELVAALIERGHAYPATDGSGDVYFDVKSWPAYGELSGQKVDDMEPAADADPRGKRDPRDFALWKGHKPEEPWTASWPSPWGRGRPGWHLECSAMAGKYLGDTFDVHGGGLDLRFPHHENELAQSRAAGKPFARYWMHNNWVTAAGEKMSKSLGNGALVSEVVKHYPPRAVRMYLAAPHYRSAIEFSDDSLSEATASLERIDSFLDRAADALSEDVSAVVLPDAFVEAMNDDLGTPKAFAVLYETIRDGNSALNARDLLTVSLRLAEVRAMLDVFGLNPADPIWDRASGGGDQLEPIVDALVERLINDRAEAKQARDYSRADEIRNQLSALGIELTDTRDGTTWSLSKQA
ncbi:cysteine--tRNA ligase [Naumannella halotolerans]|uniref:Cysteine--tRNA ligase n=1 Tax=Naumannella halotolerans TaxID=993414 RepID=A0A4V3EMG6_9ACTN|nr:cysteine--tRNA ligase [Naumannella halotolerans]TDT30058.1 cysteinyl-tRNA synthetase [Naumannella halotolerans]